ncbi:hypothetical protein [Corynebacterium casei]|uniref:hypothetical protein n=1 Tax=Corynebacterium casei TaxID=160386 RepID=UPI003F8EFEEA
MQWEPVLINLSSGSIGVIVTLLLTGWWNWRDRRDSKRLLIRTELVRYVRETTELTSELWAQFDHAALMDTEAGSVSRKQHSLDDLGKLARLIIMSLEIKSITDDAYVLKKINECVSEVSKFYKHFGFGLGRQREDAPAYQVQVVGSESDSNIVLEKIVLNIYSIYSKNNADILLYLSKK